MIKRITSSRNSTATRRVGTATGGIGGIIFALVWISFSSVFVAVGCKSAWRSLTQSAWQHVPCVIDEFQILDDPTQDEPFSAKLAFHYEIGGRQHRGHCLYPPKAPTTPSPAKPQTVAEDRDKDYQKLAALQQQYLTASEPVCLVDPQNPVIAALMVKRDDLWGSLAFGGFGLCFVGVGVGLLLQNIRQVRGGSGAAMTGKRRSDENFPAAIGVPFFGLFAAAGCGMFCFISVPLVKHLWIGQSWVATPATVQWSRIAISPGSKGGSTYKVDIFYQYTFAGKPHHSNRSDFIEASSSGRSGKEALVRANPPGKTLTCYVNPNQPWEAVRNRGPGWSSLFGLFPLPFMAVGIGGLWYLVRQSKSLRPKSLTGSASGGVKRSIAAPPGHPT